MARWIPFVVRPGPVIEAPDRMRATALAVEQHGADLVRVQAVASHEIEADEYAAIERARRLSDPDDEC